MHPVLLGRAYFRALEGRVFLTRDIAELYLIKAEESRPAVDYRFRQGEFALIWQHAPPALIVSAGASPLETAFGYYCAMARFYPPYWRHLGEHLSFTLKMDIALLVKDLYANHHQEVLAQASAFPNAALL